MLVNPNFTNDDILFENEVDSSLSSSSKRPVENKVITEALKGKSNVGHSHLIKEVTDFPTYLEPLFKQDTWYPVGEDSYIGSHGVSGGLGLLGNNGTTRLDFCKQDEPEVYKSITFDGTTLNVDGNCEYAKTAGNANTVGGLSPYHVATLDESGNSQGNSLQFYCKFNKFGDNRYGLGINSVTDYQIRVDYASNAASLSNIKSGSAVQPVYFSDGKPAPISYTIEKSVPADAEFTDTKYTEATTTKAGLLSSSDKAKLDSIVEGANKIYVDSAINNTSTNPVQNKVIYEALSGKLNVTLKGANNGLAELDSDGKVPSSQLPSSVTNVVEGYYKESKFYQDDSFTTEITGESGKIYVDLSTNKTYRWNGSVFTVISETVFLGETSSTAYRGDRGKIAYDHSQSSHARTDATKVEKSSVNGNVKINGTEVNVYTHPSGTNPHGTTKSDVGLCYVDNTSDMDKPVSTAVQSAISTHEGNTTLHITAAERTKWNKAEQNVQSDWSVSDSTSDAFIKNKPTSLPASDVSAWAKAATKPTYTAAEVGADPAGSANTALENAKKYTDTEIAGIINGAPTTLDTLGEIADAMAENKNVVDALNDAIGTKASSSDLTSHTSNKSNPHGVTKSQVGLGNVPNVATNDQTPTFTESSSLTKLTSGEKLSVAFGKISKAVTDLISHVGDSVKHITSTERTNWNAAKTHADSAHAPSGAQANIIETVKVNGSALTPSLKAVDITVPSVGNGTITIKQNGTSKGTFTTNQSGNTTIELTDNNTTYSPATTSANGLMSAEDKAKLDGIAAGSNKITVDSALSSTSTNPVQNKVINSALAGKAASSHTHVISNIDGLQSALDGKAASSHGKHVPVACTTITDWNNATTTGWYMGSGASNAPSTAWHFGYVIAHNTNYVVQEAYQFTASTDAKVIPKYIRAKMNGTWGSWTEVTVQKKVPSDAKFTDTVYTHPTTSGNKHIPAGGSSGQILRWSADGTAVWGNDNNTTYGVATTSANGLMSAEDKAKLDGIATGANKTAVDSALSSTSTNPVQNKVVYSALASKAASSHTHSYAGSSSAGGSATSAVKLDTASAGSSSQPVYFSGGKPVPCTTLGLNDYVVGTQTASTNAFTGNLSGVSALYDGLSIRYYLPYAGTSSSATLTLTLTDSGTSTAAIPVYRNSSNTFTNQCGAGSILYLTYKSSVNRWVMSAQYDADTYDRIRHNAYIKCNASTAIVANEIIVANNGLYYPLKSGQPFDITQPILYSLANIAVNATSSNTYVAIPVYVTTTCSITLTAYKPVYIKGKLSGVLFTPINTTPLTQTIPTSDDGYQYILLGNAYDTTHFYLLPHHPIFEYKNGSFGLIGRDAKTVNGHTVNSDVPTNAKFTDTVYTHPTSSGNKHIPSGGSSGQILRWSADGTAVWGNDNNTTYNDATTSTHGLMSVSDKKALDVLKTPYATCATGRATADKVATLANFTLTAGATVVVKFTDRNDTANPTSGNLTLNVNNTGARHIVAATFDKAVKRSLYYYDGATFCNNNTHIFTYDGSYWQCIDWYPVATTSASGLMSSSDKAKLNNIAAGANKTTVDSSLSSTSTNPVQNKVVYSALAGKAESSHTHTKSQITDFPSSLPANGGTADTARQVTGPSSKVRLWEDNEGGNLELVAPDGVHLMQMDIFNNSIFRMYFYDGSTLFFPFNFDFSNQRLDIEGNVSLTSGSIITPANDSMGIIPAKNNYGQIGSSDKKFFRMYATTFYGSLSGNATSATSATTATNAGNADTVDGLHAYYMATLNANGGTHGTDFPMYCRHNVLGDNRFYIGVGGGYERSVAVGYAETAGYVPVSAIIKSATFTVTTNSAGWNTLGITYPAYNIIGYQCNTSDYRVELYRGNSATEWYVYAIQQYPNPGVVATNTKVSVTIFYI